MQVRVGRPRPGDRVSVRVLRDKADAGGPFPLAGATLNGFRASSATNDVCTFPFSCVCTGRNVFAIGPAGTKVVAGLELTLTPASGGEFRKE